MSDNDESKRETLRQKAEARLGDSHKLIEGLSPDDLKALIHDYQVHQIELELQNEEFRTAQQEITAGRKRYFDLFDLAPVGYCMVDEKGVIQEANLTVVKMLDVTLGALVKQPVSRFILKDDQDIYYLHRKKLFETGESQECELRLVKSDGVLFWAHLTETIAQAEDGAPVYRMVIRDITERKRAEEALRESERQLRELFENAPVGIFRSTPHGRYLSMNPEYARLFGYGSSSEMIEQVTDIAAQLYVRPEQREIYKEHLIGQGVVKNFEAELKRLDGATLWVSMDTRLTRDQHEDIVFEGFLTDITDRKRAEEALRENAIRRHILVDQSRDGIVVLNQDGSVHEANKRYAEMLGYSPEEVQQLHIWDWDLNWSREQLLKMLKKVDQEGDHFETRHRRKDGTFYDVEISTNGAVIGGRQLIFCVCRDIAERKRAEMEQARSREMLLQAEILANLGCLEWDIVCDAWSVSNNWRCIMGHHAPLLSSSELFACVHPEDRWRVKRAIATTMRTGEPYGILHRILRGDTGEVRHVQTYGVVEFNKSGEPVRGFGAVLDITERKLTEEALQESEARFRNLLEQVPTVAVQGYSMDGVAQYWNQASETIYGYCSKEAVGKNLVDLIIPDEMRREVVEAIKKMSETKVPIPSAELNLKRKDGSRVPVYSSHAIVQKPGSSPELFCIDVDLTELKQAEKALLRAKELAEAANQAKSGFLANMSHEIRTPINGIMGMMQLLETTTLDADQRQYVELAMHSAQRLTRLLSDILDLSRVEAGKLEVRAEEFETRQLGDSVLELFTFHARTKRIALNCSIDPAMPARIIGDGARVRQILFNLVGNALKYSEEGAVNVGMIPLPAKKQGYGRVLFTVEDTGVGIPEDRLKDIFEPFTQVDSSLTRQYQGAGLGLTIVRRLVELLGGSLYMESAVGQGTTVHVTLPFTMPDEIKAAAEEEVSKTSESGKSPLCILLAEDDPSNALPIRKLLEKAGHSVTLAANGQQALDLLAVQIFDVILMDVQMPVMSGLEATKAIRSSTDLGPKKDIPIIALTAYAMVGDREKFLAAGMDYYLAKPVMMEDLQKALERIHATGFNTAG